ncbi:hypothetical protein HYS03_00870 [Candidatus Woesebacteria bacterium]|nr:hypothetical protein [Candidatus Woesebacteria bacterium]QQG47213.1 MAG: hypothetical protein HY044_03680 [Candidatus Woesebacteria bacterium]
MARPKADEIQKELEKQDEIYGEEIVGEDESYSDIDETRKKVTGEEPRLNESADLARKIDEDEKALAHDEEEEEVENEEEEDDLPSGFHVEDEHNDIDE